MLADTVSHASAALARAPSRPWLRRAATGSVLVVAGESGTTVHRADCPLIAGRADIIPAGPDGSQLSPCRVCKPVG